MKCRHYGKTTKVGFVFLYISVNEAFRDLGTWMIFTLHVCFALH